MQIRKKNLQTYYWCDRYFWTSFIIFHGYKLALLQVFPGIFKPHVLPLSFIWVVFMECGGAMLFVAIMCGMHAHC